MRGDRENRDATCDGEPAPYARRHPAAGVCGCKRQREVQAAEATPTPAANATAAAGPSRDSAAATAANEAIVSGLAAVMARKRAYSVAGRAARLAGGGSCGRPLARDGHEAVDGDPRHDERREHADLTLVAGEGRARGRSCHCGYDGEPQVGRGHAHPGCHARARTADHSRFDQQQAHDAHLHRDGEARGQTGNQCGAGIHWSR